VVDEDPAVAERVRRVSRALAPWIEPLAVDQPHVTVWVHGFDPPEPHPELGARVPVEIGRVGSFTSCPFLEVRSEAIRRLREGCAGREERWAGYLPHLTVGRYAADTSIDVLLPELRPWRRLPPIRTEGRLVLAAVDAFDPGGSFRVLEPPTPACAASPRGAG